MAKKTTRTAATARKSTPRRKAAPVDALVSAAPASPSSSGPRDAEASREFALAAARTAHDDHCENIVLLDVTRLSSVTDFIVIASGTSDRQMRSVLHHIEEAGSATGNPPFRVSADERATWLIADFVDVVVHLFEPGTREHYDLEMMWGDAVKVAWQRPEPKTTTKPKARKATRA
jgi:ribosome-associated protein